MSATNEREDHSKWANTTKATGNAKVAVLDLNVAMGR